MAHRTHQSDESRTAPGGGPSGSELSPLDDPERAIAREVEVVAERFPGTDVTVVEAAVREIVEELRAEAQVETHVLALSRHRVYERLCAQGHEFQPGTDSSAESETGPEPEDIDRAGSAGTGDVQPEKTVGRAAGSPPD